MGLLLVFIVPALASSLLQDCTHTTYIPDPIRSVNMITSTAYTTTQCTIQYWDCKGCNQVAVIPYGHVWAFGVEGEINNNDMVSQSRVQIDTECPYHRMSRSLQEAVNEMKQNLRLSIERIE